MALPHAAILVTVPTVEVMCICNTILTWIIYTTVFLQCIYIDESINELEAHSPLHILNTIWRGRTPTLSYVQVLQTQRSLSNCTEGATKACCHQLYSSNQKRVTCIFVNLAVDNNINSNNINFYTPWNDKVSVSFSKKQAYSCTLICTYMCK